MFISFEVVSIADALCHLCPAEPADPAELICGVPYSALPIATCMAIRENLPMVMCRKEAKSYGTKQMVEGTWKPGQHCLVVEDVITSGASLASVVELLRNEGMSVSRALVLVDRENGGADILRSKHKLSVTSLFTLTELVDILSTDGRISENERNSVVNFIRSTQIDPTPVAPQSISFCPRLKASLDQLIQSKSTQLCVAIDTTDPMYLLKLADKLGPKVCALKLHLDILQFDTGSPEQFVSQLRGLAVKHGFFIVEDRLVLSGDDGAHITKFKCCSQFLCGPSVLP
ncbi:unnamed protein product [Echinostoma caproni]|uniref:Orotate phosphoribosyltransferase n=1 Tax=Echinostoma caproni TaxID=27848 RepID=A0A183B1T8_9TREM|nr:unnamed protein product [Echinostoma caproni]